MDFFFVFSNLQNNKFKVIKNNFVKTLSLGVVIGIQIDLRYIFSIFLCPLSLFFFFFWFIRAANSFFYLNININLKNLLLHRHLL